MIPFDEIKIEQKLSKQIGSKAMAQTRAFIERKGIAIPSKEFDFNKLRKIQKILLSYKTVATVLYATGAGLIKF